MYIDAEAFLQYRDGSTIASGWERLELVVKFKERGKLFRTKLVETLATTFGMHSSHYKGKRYDTYDEYYDDVESIINDTDLIKMRVEEVVKDYFVKKYEDEMKDNRLKNIQKRVNNLSTLKVRVKLDS